MSIGRGPGDSLSITVCTAIIESLLTLILNKKTDLEVLLREVTRKTHDPLYARKLTCLLRLSAIAQSLINELSLLYASLMRLLYIIPRGSACTAYSLGERMHSSTVCSMDPCSPSSNDLLDLISRFISLTLIFNETVLSSNAI